MHDGADLLEVVGNAARLLLISIADNGEVWCANFDPRFGFVGAGRHATGKK